MEEVQIIVEASSLSESMQRKLDKIWGEPNEIENFTIFRAPRIMHQSKKHLFEPSVISIGPFHRGQKSLQAMEEQKWRFLWDFLSRGDHISLDLCISEMKQLEERTRRCYSETVDLDSNSFVEMMLLDGCFVLEFFLRRKEGRWDSTYEVGWNHVYVDWDLLLLENQIPFFVVEKLCEIGVEKEDRTSFVNDIISNMSTGQENYTLTPNPPAQIDHLIHLYHNCSVPTPEKQVVLSSKSFQLPNILSPNRIKGFLLWFLSWVLAIFPSSTSPGLSGALANSTRNPSKMVIPCATELQDAGLKLRVKSNPQHMLDVSFDNGVLQIPRQTITDISSPLFINLIAFEQCKFHKMYVHFSSFATLLDSLVNTQKDAMILQQCGIIENWLSGEEELTRFFNLLGDGTCLENDHFLGELFMEVNRYCESSWNRQRAKLIRDYFSSPWTAISLVAALVLLVLTCVQSFFAVYAFYVLPS